MPPKPEGFEQKQAFEIYLNMGANRGVRVVGRKINRDATTISRWKRDYKWDERVLEANRDGLGTGVTTLPPSMLQKREEESLMQVELRTLSETQYRMIQQSLKVDEETGKLSPEFEIKNLSQFNATVKSFRETVEPYHKLSRASGGAKGSTADKLVELMKLMVGQGSLGKEDSIGFLKPGQSVPERIPTRDIGAAGGVSEADFTEVSDGAGVLNRPKEGTTGSGGVSGSSGETGSGDEGKLWQPGTLLCVRDFVQPVT